MNDKKIFWFFGALITVVVFMFVSTNAANFALSSQTNKVNNVVPSTRTVQDTNKIQNTNSEVQIVKLSMRNYQYVVEPSSLKKGVPVRMEADLSTLVGCSKSIVIPSFGIRKVVSSGNNIIEFTPDKAGTFTMSCSMNMYKGQFTVLESDGTQSNFADPSINNPDVILGGSAGSCGSGGCGCGAG